MDQGPITPTSGNRPRPRSRGISFGSNRSGVSESKSKYVESPKDKAKRDSLWTGLSKANPNAALQEVQPGVANLVEESTLQNIRDLHHKDANGQDIADPDRSNPTRHRMERPLDTIRNFERAIDDGYKRRSTYGNGDGEQYDRNKDYASKRSSYIGGEYAQFNRRRANTNHSAGYGNGPHPNGQHHGSGGGYYGNQGGYYGNNRGPPRQRYGDRMQSDPQIYSQQRQYPQHGYHQSHDTVNTGMTNGSDSTGPWANSTDPSSENSSLDRVAANKPQTPMDPYGQYPQNGYNGPIMENEVYGDYWQRDAGYGGQNSGYQLNDDQQQDPQSSRAAPQAQPQAQQQQQQFSSPREIYARHNSAPMPPQHAYNGNNGNSGRRPVPLNAPPPSGPPARYNTGNSYGTRPQPEKRKSWLARKFSRKD